MAETDRQFPVKGVIPVEQMFSEDEEDLRLLNAMASEARAFLSEFTWCGAIREAYFGDGYGGIVAVFFFRIEPAKPTVDEWLWVVVGDVPPAYLVIDDCKTPSQALEGYIEEMRKWVALAKDGRSSNDVIPVNAPATPEFAAMLESRLNVFQESFVPAFQSGESMQS